MHIVECRAWHFDATNSRRFWAGVQARARESTLLACMPALCVFGRPLASTSSEDGTVTRKPTSIKLALQKQLGIRLSPDMTTQLEAIARREQNPVSSVARRLLTTALAQERKDGTA